MRSMAQPKKMYVKASVWFFSFGYFEYYLTWFPGDLLQTVHALLIFLICFYA